MGEVYRASDPKIGRDVAIKVLPADFAADKDRVARFEQEAQAAGALNHPNILAIYDIDTDDGLLFVVSELLEGEELRELLDEGSIPLRKAIDYAQQIVSGLTAAHEKGITHRDLKPENLFITKDDRVKILDFGLAKLRETNISIHGSEDATRKALTDPGMVMGTAGYMSPEQVRGQKIDHRSDIFSFGVILYEMITGNRAFQEESLAETMSAIVKEEPQDMTESNPNISPALEGIVYRCLEKKPDRRFQSTSDLGFALGTLTTTSGSQAETVFSPPNSRRRFRASNYLLGIVPAVALTAIAALALFWFFREPQPQPHASTFVAFEGGFVPASALISPDGRKIAFLRDARLWVRHLDQLEPVRLEGTEGATLAVWSPDSESILYIARGDLLSVPVAGGAPVTVAFGVGEAVFGGAGGLGVLGDRVVYASGDAGIQEVSLHGGKPRDVVVPNGDPEADFHTPSFLPDGGILFVVHRAPEIADTIAVNRDGRTKYVFQTEGQGIVSPVYSRTGHLVFRRNGPKAGLWAAPFSLASLEVTGEPFLITKNGIFPTVADDGTLLFVRNAGEGGVRSQLVWVARDGTVGESVGPEMDGISSPALSPDGKRVAIMRPEVEPGNIWVFDVDGDSRSRLTFGSPTDWDPVWSADGKSIVFWQGSTRVLARIPADGSGQAERIVKPELLDSGVPSMSPDGKWMAFWARPEPLVQDLMAVDLTGDGTPVPVVASPAIENHPSISPDNRYLAYVSNESGRFEVYVTRFPSGEGKWQISTQGGLQPKWSPSGGELFYVRGSVLCSVKITLADVPSFNEPVDLFDAVNSSLIVGWNQRFEVSRDGKSFLMVKDRQSQDSPPGIVISYGWLAAAQARQ